MTVPRLSSQKLRLQSGDCADFKRQSGALIDSQPPALCQSTCNQTVPLVENQSVSFKVGQPLEFCYGFHHQQHEQLFKDPSRGVR